MHAKRSSVIVICFAVSSHNSFKDLEDTWLEGLKFDEQSRQIPIVLIGTKSDLDRKVRESEVRILMDRINS